MTKFAIIAFYQYSENYGDEVEPFWKQKGGHEVVIASELTLAEVTDLGSEGMRALVEENGPKSNPFAGYDLVDWELVELGPATIEKVRSFIEANDDPDQGYVRFCYTTSHSEFEFDWAVAQMAT